MSWIRTISLSVSFKVNFPKYSNQKATSRGEKKGHMTNCYHVTCWRHSDSTEGLLIARPGELTEVSFCPQLLLLFCCCCCFLLLFFNCMLAVSRGHDVFPLCFSFMCGWRASVFLCSGLLKVNILLVDWLPNLIVDNSNENWNKTDPDPETPVWKRN